MGGSVVILNRAKAQKNDEFYTPQAVINNELIHYKDHFKDKVVYCNCDDPEWSEFYKFFKLRMALYGIKKLISTHYVLPNTTGIAYKLVCVLNENREVIETRTQLEGNGDFRSPECVALLEQADIVCTNPPFSLFREYVALLMQHNKKFLIIGNINAPTYAEFYTLFKQKLVWSGIHNSGTMPFALSKEALLRHPDKCNDYTRINTTWYTNLGHTKQKENIKLYATYSPEKYPKYDNFDAISVNKVAEIPQDYFNNMGVPITFLLRHNTDQFEIVGSDRELTKQLTGKVQRFVIKGKKLYARIVIKRKGICNGD